MKSFITSCCAAVVLAGCSSASEPVSQLAPLPAAPPAARLDTSSNLLYVANPDNGAVDFYSYKNGLANPKVGTIAISDPTGVCTDRAGDVYVVSYSGHRVSKFAHGATSPESSLRFTAYPYACAVDQSNGDLAVSVQTPHGKFYRGADVQVFTAGEGRPRKYVAQDGFAKVFFMAYDNKHNLYATGEPCNDVSYCNYGSNGGPPGLFELTPSSQYFNELGLGTTVLRDPTGLAWIKPTLLVIDANYKKQREAVGLKIFVTSSKATVVGTIPFASTKAAQGVSVRAGIALVADQGSKAVQSYSISDGSLLATLKDRTGAPLAVAVSQAK